MSAPWSAEELAWARECFLSGDSLEEIADWSGREVQDIVAKIGTGRNISPRQRDILSLYTAGCSFPEIAQERGGSWKAAAAAVSELRTKGLAIPRLGRRPADALRAA